MPGNEILQRISTLSPDQFVQVCQGIVHGLGFTQSRLFPAENVQVAFREELIRKSTDKMFSTPESWLLAFACPDNHPTLEGINAILEAAKSAGVKNLLTVIFGEVLPEESESYHVSAQKADLKGVLLSGLFAEELASDYAFNMPGQIGERIFSFARLREHMQQQGREAMWRSHFQSLTLHVPRTAHSRSNSDAILGEADLFRALSNTGSFLLLGEPGAGKTTSLQELTEELAQSGGRTPVLMSLNRYTGNLLIDLGEILCEGTNPLSADRTHDLLSSGVLTVLLDGINEIQLADRQKGLIDEINHFTDPSVPTSRSQWIVSSRNYDFSISSQPLVNLERVIWELQPLSPDLVYRFLADGLGEEEGEDTYYRLGSTIRDICGNPLLLNMLFIVRQKIGSIPTRRGTLYHQFIDLLLRWKEDLPENKEHRNALSKFIGYNLTIDNYCNLAREVMSHLAGEMKTTAISWGEARDLIEDFPTISRAPKPADAAAKVIEELLRQGIMKKADSSGKISFFHHTIQEYFQAYNLKDDPPSALIPHGGAQGPQRESVIFVAGIIDDPNGLIERALEIDDPLLAYEIMSVTKTSTSKTVQHRVAKKIWQKTVSGGLVIGDRKHFAQIFINIASDLDQTVEQLARNILNPSNEEYFTAQLLRFHEEIGDLKSRQELLKSLSTELAEEMPGNYLFSEAVLAGQMGNHQKAVALWTKYIEQDPSSSAAYGNRANHLKALGKRQEAFDDYKKAIELYPTGVVSRTSFARLLAEMNRREEAINELRVAIHNNPNYAQAHFELGKLVESSDGEMALSHLEQAVQLVIDPSDQETYLQKLLELQEKYGRFVGAMRSIRRLIELAPTSRNVRGWKQKYAEFRQVIDEIDNRRSVRQKLREGGDVPLAAIAKETLTAAGWQVEHITSQRLRALSDIKGLPSPLPIILVDVPQLTGSLVQGAISSLPKELVRIEYIVLMTTAEELTLDARMELIKYRSEHPVALITAVEAREALLQGDRYCRDFLSKTLRRLTEDDPFDYRNLVQEKTEFFGRTDQIKDLTGLVRERKSVALYGIHKTGKSSLLRQIQFNLQAYSPEITILWVEMRPGMRESSDLYHEILKKLPIQPVILAQEAISTNHFRNTLGKFHENKLREYPDHHLLLILDEYPYLIPDKYGKRGIENFLEVLGIFKAMCQEGWFSILPCGRTSALSRTEKWEQGENPFIGMLKERFLEPLTQEETKELVQVLGLRADLRFDDNALAKIFAITGGHPFFTRMLGSLIRKKYRGKLVSAELVEEAAKEYLNQGELKALLLKIYHEELEDEERRIVEQLVIGPLPRNKLAPTNANRQDILRLLASIENLLVTSVIKEDERGLLSHRYELLRRAIEQEIKELEAFLSEDS